MCCFFRPQMQSPPPTHRNNLQFTISGPSRSAHTKRGLHLTMLSCSPPFLLPPLPPMGHRWGTQAVFDPACINTCNVLCRFPGSPMGVPHLYLLKHRKCRACVCCRFPCASLFSPGFAVGRLVRSAWQVVHVCSWG